MFKNIVAIAAILLLTACTKVVPVKQTEIGFELHHSGEWKKEVYIGENIFLDAGTFMSCRKKCDDAHIYDAAHTIVNINGNYAMPKSNDMDLTLELEIKVAIDTTGGEAAIRKRAMEGATRYRYIVEGKLTQNQIFRTPIKNVTNIDLNVAAVKGKIRPILEPYTLSEAYYNISKNGSILEKMKNEIKQLLKDQNSILTLISIQVKRVSQPEELLAKKRREEGLESEDAIQKRQLEMQARRMAQQQLIQLKAAANELELLEINSEFMTDRVLAYKWIQTAQMFAEAGLPFAVDTNMLIPALSKTSDMSIDVSKAKARLEQRISQVENEIATTTECAENDTDGNCKN